MNWFSDARRAPSPNFGDDSRFAPAGGPFVTASARRSEARRLYEQLGRPRETEAARMVAELVFERAEQQRAQLEKATLVPLPESIDATTHAIIAQAERIYRVVATYDSVADYGVAAWQTAATVRVGDLLWCQAEAVQRAATPVDDLAQRELFLGELRLLRAELRVMAHEHWTEAAARTTDPVDGVDWVARAKKRTEHPPDC